MKASSLPLVAVVAAMTAVSPVAASSEHAATYMYQGRTMVGSIAPEGPVFWTIDCSYSGGVVYTGLRHRERLNVEYMDGSLAGYSRIQRDGRWAIYIGGSPRRLVGIAVRRSSTRWDVMRRQRVVGHTVGPDGPAAATALFTIC